MPPAIIAIASRFAGPAGLSRQSAWRGAAIALPHLLAALLLLLTETEPAARTAFVLTWGLLNCFWLMLFRRPGFAGAASLTMIVLLILLSQLKHSVVYMTANFIDVMIIDYDTFGFLLTIMPTLGRNVVLTGLIVLPLLGVIWWIDPLRVRRRSAALVFAGLLFGLWALATALPTDREEAFEGSQFVSKFARSAIPAVEDLVVRGLFESDADIVQKLKPTPAGETCAMAKKPPHIVMVFDESSFDATNIPGAKVPADYRRHFASFDGKNRALVVEGAGGPSWFTEYNILTGLSARSYGRFAEFVTRIAAGRVERGLPWALRRCGYKTHSFYSYMGAFLSARRFQETAGIEHFHDAKALGAEGVEPDSFFYNAASNVIEQERGTQPLFLLVYTIANHFPWDYRFKPELAPDWQPTGNDLQLDEYLRRQTLSRRDYNAFVAKLKKDFPGESFLVVRFGDHLPGLAMKRIEPGLSDEGVGKLVNARDPRYFSTYYAIDAINYRLPDLKLALPRLDAPYLPLVVMEAAGVPLDPSFAEQRRILERCQGQFYQCGAGAEVRRFNRMLIEAGLIKGL